MAEHRLIISDDSSVAHPAPAPLSPGHGYMNGSNFTNVTHGLNASHHEAELACGEMQCLPGILVPLWQPAKGISDGYRAGRFFVYLFVQIYLFVGMSLVADRFVAAIEVIVSKKRKVKVSSRHGNNNGGEPEYVQIPIWNETVAHLTLFVLGGCAPEILLTLVETITNGFQLGELGPGTIIGSGCYNLFIITGICIISVGSRAKRIIELPIFFTTAAWSIFAYLWLYFITVLNTHGIIEVWEALTTLAFFPALVLSAYVVDKHFFGLFNCFCPHKGVHPSTEAETAKEVLDRREKRFVALMEELRSRYPAKTSAELQELAELEFLKELPKGRNYYRMEAARRMAGGGELINKEKLREKFTHNPAKKSGGDLDLQTIAFDPATYTVMEDAGKCQLNIIRDGQRLDNSVTVDYMTKDGTGKDGADYRRTSGQLLFQSHELLKHIFVEIVDDDTYKPDTVFYVNLSNPKMVSIPGKAKVQLGENSTATVTKLDDDHGGFFHFVGNESEFEESCEEAVVKILRSCGARGSVMVPIKIRPIDAIPGVHYHDPKISRVTFEDRESEYSLSIKIIDEGKLDAKAVKFELELGQPAWAGSQKIDSFDPSKLGKPQLRDPRTITVTITENKGLKQIVNDIAEADVGELVSTSTWSEQFVSAFTVATAEPENENDPPRKTFYEYAVHVITFFWKLLFAFIPPTVYLGGWAAFFVAFALIGVITAVIRDIASGIGCTVGLSDELTAVTFVSLGTSLPDLYASRIAAVREETADAAIGHISGANAVNVFLGMGLAWSIAAIKQSIDGKPLKIKVGSISYCIILFFSFASCAIIVLFLRRLPPIHGELGGPRIFKFLTVMLFWSLWAAYIVLVALDGYCIIRPSL